MSHVTVSPEAIFAGRAVFTVANAIGTHYTYKVTRKKNEGKPPVFFAQALTGPDNDADFTYIGILTPEGDVHVTKASRVTADSQVVRVLAWAVKRVLAGREFPPGYSCLHEGACCRCGRTLTHPESLLTGLGPVCSRRE